MTARVFSLAVLIFTLAQQDIPSLAQQAPVGTESGRTASRSEAPRGLTAEELEQERQLKAEGHAIVDVAAIWPTLIIEVCWEPASSRGFPAQKILVREAVKVHIENNSEYRFPDDWGDCDASDRPRIRINIEDGTPRSEVGFQGGVGTSRARATRMWLNFTYANWSSDYCSNPTNTNRCLEFNAVHEFLHALGVLHEQLHPDVDRDDPACFARYRDHNRFDVHGRQPVALTRYSQNSAMNYCENGHYHNGVSLSQEDKLSLGKMAALSWDRMAGRR